MTVTEIPAAGARLSQPVNLADTALFAHGDPHSAWAWLRRNAPVYWNADPAQPGGGFWVLTRYADLMTVYVDPQTFSSERGTVLGGSFRSATDTASGRMIICADPPEHRLMRQQVHRGGFSAAVTPRVAATVTEFTEAAMKRLVAAGGGDLAAEVAPELAAAVLVAMLGVDRDEAHHLLALSRAMIGHQDPEYHAGRDPKLVLAEAQMRMFDFLAELVERRRAAPGEDLISYLLSARINGRPLTFEKILYNCLNVVVGGNETTPYTACGGVLALIEHPVQADKFYADPGVLPTAVEEIFRWTSTNAYVGRTVTRDTRIRDVDLPAGARITLWNASANRDEEQFPHPDRFDVTRSPNHHLAFGAGPHRCIGQQVARQEITIFFDHLRRGGIRMALAGPVARLRSNFMLGVKHLPVTVVEAGAR